MSDLTFAQQLQLSLLNSGVLLIGGGYVLNRALADRNAKHSLRAKMAETRIPKIADEVARLVRVETSVLDFLRHCWEVGKKRSQERLELEDEIHASVKAERDADAAEDSSFDREVARAHRRVIAARLAEMPDTQTEMFKSVVRENIEVRTTIFHAIEASWKEMHRQQFWLGPTIAGVLERRYADLWNRIFRPERALEWIAGLPAAPTATGSMNWLERGIQRLKEYRDDRELAKLGMSATVLKTDISRMIDHVSG